MAQVTAEISVLIASIALGCGSSKNDVFSASPSDAGAATTSSAGTVGASGGSTTGGNPGSGGSNAASSGSPAEPSGWAGAEHEAGAGSAGDGAVEGASPAKLEEFVGSVPEGPCAQAEHFLLGLSADAKNAAFPEPMLSVACSATQVTVTSNNIPSFEFVQKTPNALLAMTMTYRFPRFPKPAPALGKIPLGGTVAVAVNGLAIFGPTENPAMQYRDPYLDGLLDFCNGHTAPGGMYHFHARPDCLFRDLEGNVRLVVGYAFDGYPILAPYKCSATGDCEQTEHVESSWQRIASRWDGDEPNYQGTTEGSWDLHEYVAGSGSLDECNGTALPGGGYAYYATDTFPYFVGCYHGTPTNNRMR